MIRLRSFAIQNFRTFRERTVIDLTGADGNPDAVVTFHGDNGSGKSNALAALSFFFHGLKFLLDSGATKFDFSSNWDKISYFILPSDIPREPGEDGYVEVEFEGTSIQKARIAIASSEKVPRLSLLVEGGDVLAKKCREHVEVISLMRDLDVLDYDLDIIKKNRDRFFVPFSWMEVLLRNDFSSKDFDRAFGSINARRQVLWLSGQTSSSILPPEIAEGLFALRTSLVPEERQAWRSYTEQLRRIPTLQRFETHIELDRKTSKPRLVFEDAGLSVLTLEQLSSGEQQLVVLLAVALLARANLLAIEEPEISLDTKNQALLRELLGGLVKSKAIGQVILESHAPSFDGPQVIRFSRDESGASRASREDALQSPSELTRRDRSRRPDGEGLRS
jgi:ABC-type cobalamin/Fe3+-siderophores transport system ATPase subunit